MVGEGGRRYCQGWFETRSCSRGGKRGKKGEGEEGSEERASGRRHVYVETQAEEEGEKKENEEDEKTTGKKTKVVNSRSRQTKSKQTRQERAVKRGPHPDAPCTTLASHESLSLVACRLLSWRGRTDRSERLYRVVKVVPCPLPLVLVNMVRSVVSFCPIKTSALCQRALAFGTSNSGPRPPGQAWNSPTPLLSAHPVQSLQPRSHILPSFFTEHGIRCKILSRPLVWPPYRGW
jgi:hypothetical protein